MDDPHAFPHPTALIDTRRTNGGVHPRLPIVSEGGMSLRDWFAGQALIGLLAHASGESPHKAPEMAWQLADMMMEQRP